MGERPPKKAGTEHEPALEKKTTRSRGDGIPKLQISVPCRGRTCPEFLNGVLVKDIFEASRNTNFKGILEPQNGLD